MHPRMRGMVLAGAELACCEQAGCHHSIGERHGGRDAEPTPYVIETFIASKTAAEVATQPKMPPWALIIFRPIS